MSAAAWVLVRMCNVIVIAIIYLHEGVYLEFHTVDGYHFGLGFLEQIVFLL